MIKEIEDKFMEYVSNNVTISEETYASWYNKDTIIKRAHIDCPCGSDRLQFVEVHIDSDGDLTGNWHIKELAWKLSTHVEKKIRLRADKEHIDILTNIIGKEKSLELIYVWAKKNIVVAAALMEYIKMSNCDALHESKDDNNVKGESQ